MAFLFRSKKKSRHGSVDSSQPFPGVRLHSADTPVVERVRSETSDNRRNSWVYGTEPLFGTSTCATLAPKGSCESIQGTRATMEDTWTSIDILNAEVPLLGDAHRFAFYGVYDGHCGDQAARLCRDELHRRVSESPHFAQGNIEQAFIAGLLSLDRAIIQSAQADGWNAGATVAAAVIVDSSLYTANLGDSLVVLAQRPATAGGDPVPITLTKIHKASVPEEKQRIIEAGGMVMSGRVYGDLAVSRAVGDKQYKRPVADADFVSPVPYTTKCALSLTQHDFVILATDGLWDKVTPADAVKHVANLRTQKPEPTPHELARSLVELASQRGSSDNITVLVVLFHWTAKDDDIASIAE